ncbi:hypothetical protein NUV89_10225 [Pseudomonas sp. 18.1.10]|uniref:hypothetical protein n=1 Tax=Pseudomonas sp. 18.1.10 TaxID=2969302 RepID=UPI002150550F|nr:hypothetical protein [Pseudomonas sp. 18.1.10]MCR4538768.1 hypothetical protein [Pseudomonas sp. 18.1.10]
MVFGKDNDVVCNLVSLEETSEDYAFFESLIAAGEARHWESKVFWGDPDQTHKVLVLCRTVGTARKVKVLTNISTDLLDLRKEQANSAGYTFFTTGVGERNLMVYY